MSSSSPHCHLLSFTSAKAYQRMVSALTRQCSVQTDSERLWINAAKRKQSNGRYAERKPKNNTLIVFVKPN